MTKGCLPVKLVGTLSDETDGEEVVKYGALPLGDVGVEWGRVGGWAMRSASSEGPTAAPGLPCGCNS